MKWPHPSETKTVTLQLPLVIHKRCCTNQKPSWPGRFSPRPPPNRCGLTLHVTQVQPIFFISNVILFLHKLFQISVIVVFPFLYDSVITFSCRCIPKYFVLHSFISSTWILYVALNASRLSPLKHSFRNAAASQPPHVEYKIFTTSEWQDKIQTSLNWCTS